VKLNFLWNGDRVKKAMEDAGKEVMRRAADYMAERARMLCPVDTGELLASIQVTSSMNGMVFNVVATAPYAEWVEFGHLAGGVTWVAPNPFMRTARADTIAAFPQIARQVKLGRPGGDNTLSHLGITLTAQKG
jgi:hypothetical protein